MITEVQIKNCSSHLVHLRGILSCIGVGLGMSPREIEETGSAVSEVCAGSGDPGTDAGDGKLSVRLCTHDSYMTVEITDPRSDCSPACSGGGYPAAMLERVGRLADKVELIRGVEGIVVVITKYAAKQEPSLSKPMRYLASVGTTSLQS